MMVVQSEMSLRNDSTTKSTDQKIETTTAFFPKADVVICGGSSNGSRPSPPMGTAGKSRSFLTESAVGRWFCNAKDNTFGAREAGTLISKLY